MVNWWNREVAALVTGFVATVATVFNATGIPCSFNRVDVVVAGVLIGFKPDVIKNIKLSFCAEINRVSDPG